VWAHPLFNERNEFGEHHHVLHALRTHPKIRFEYLGKSTDTFYYTLEQGSR
jgi:hypothetical protein